MENDMATKHTPTPWFPGRTFGRGISTVDAIDPADGQLFAVCEVFGVNKMDEACEVSNANAAFIVRAVNSHERLVAALREAEGVIAEVCVDQHPDNVCCHVLRQVRAALAEVEA
jgi:hypothetical protein